MPKIFELLGYPISDTSASVQESRSRTYCPFMSDLCDGGGNRYMSDIDLSEHPLLAQMFPGKSRVPSGVCSIQLNEGTSPWIICPRRLWYMGRKADDAVLRGQTQESLLSKCGYGKGTLLGIWSEVKIKYLEKSDDDIAFDYTFDYVLMPLGSVAMCDAVSATGMEEAMLTKCLMESGHTFALRNGRRYIEDFPVGNPVIVEVLPSSTSGCTKPKGSCIPQAFEDGMLGRQHIAPGINYRQVWARMASQLIVKSQAAMSWGGKTIWVLQDLLADYISSSTALDLTKFINEHTGEVNILAFSYGENYKTTTDARTVPFAGSTLYSGPIKANGDNSEPCFQDIVLASVCPPRNIFLTALCKKGLANRLSV